MYYQTEDGTIKRDTRYYGADCEYCNKPLIWTGFKTTGFCDRECDRAWTNAFVADMKKRQ